MGEKPQNTMVMPLGVVIRRMPGITRWAKHVWKAVAVLPGAPQAHWTVLRQEGDVVEFHAATLPLELHRTDTEGYLTGLADNPPSVYVVMRDSADPDVPLDMVLVTASPFEAQDYADSAEELVEKVPMPEGLVAWVRDFANAHHEEDVFIKRRRDRVETDKVEDGIGDPRISQMSDVYRAPSSPRTKEQLH